MLELVQKSGGCMLVFIKNKENIIKVFCSTDLFKRDHDVLGHEGRRFFVCLLISINSIF
jgi:hypothetical protein